MKEFKQAQIDALAIEIFNEFNGQKEGITMQEAQEMARMELNEKQMRRYEKSDTSKKKVVREQKIDYDKQEILDLLIKGFTEKHPRMVQVKNQSEFSFNYKENAYTVKLIKHRQPR